MGFNICQTQGCNSLSSTVFAKFQCFASLDDGGKCMAIYNRQTSPLQPEAVIFTVDTAGNLSFGTPLALVNARDWELYKADIVKVAADKALAAGENEILDTRLVLLSYSGTTISEESAVDLDFPPTNVLRPRLAWDYANSRGLLWFPQGDNNTYGVGVSGTVISTGTPVTVDNGGYSSSDGNAVIFDSTSSRYILLHRCNRSGTTGIWAMTCQVDASLNVINETTPVLLKQITINGGEIDIVYQPTADRYVVGFNADNLSYTGVLQLSGSTLTYHSEQQLGFDSEGRALCVGAHPTNGAVFAFVGNTNGIDTHFYVGKIVNDDILWGGEIDPWPSSSINVEEFTEIIYDAPSGWMVMGGTRSDDPQVWPFQFDAPIFIDLPVITVRGGERPLVDVNISLPGFQKYTGTTHQLSINGEMEPLQVDDFYIDYELVPRLSGQLPALEGEISGGGWFDSEIPALESPSFVLYNETTLVVDGQMPALTGSASGFVYNVGEMYGQFQALEGIAYGGALIDGETPALEGSAIATVTASLGLTGEIPALEGLITATNEGRSFLIGELPALMPLWGALEGEIPAVYGRGKAAVTELSTKPAWVVNKANNAVTRYPSYGFQFVMRWHGKQYLAASDGLYVFDQSESTCPPINATFKFPPTDYGTTAEKRCPRIYLHGRFSGGMATSFSVDEGLETQELFIGRDGADNWRAKMPRGMKGHLLQHSVSNVDGADFEVEQFEPLIHSTGRKG